MYTLAHSINYTKEKKTNSSSQFSPNPIKDVFFKGQKKYKKKSWQLYLRKGSKKENTIGKGFRTRQFNSAWYIFDGLQHNLVGLLCSDHWCRNPKRWLCHPQNWIFLGHPQRFCWILGYFLWSNEDRMRKKRNLLGFRKIGIKIRGPYPLPHAANLCHCCKKFHSLCVLRNKTLACFLKVRNFQLL